MSHESETRSHESDTVRPNPEGGTIRPDPGKTFPAFRIKLEALRLLASPCRSAGVHADESSRKRGRSRLRDDRTDQPERAAL